MPIPQVPSRVIKFRGAKPSFPATVELQAELIPKELFGLEPLSGRLLLHPQGEKVELTTDLFTGGIKSEARTAKLPFPRTASCFFDLAFNLHKDIAKVSGELSSGVALERAVHLVAAHLPGMLATALNAPVDIADMFGTLGDQFFTVEVRGTFERVVRVTDVGEAISNDLKLLRSLPAARADRIFAAQRYFNQVLWLSYSARHPQQFAAERLLNLNKVLEVLYPHGSKVENLRTQLKKLKLRREVRELFASVVYIRNQVDVAHAKLGFLNQDDFSAFHEFLLFATEMTGWLIRHTVELTIDDSGHHKQPTVSASSIPALAKAKELMVCVNPLRPQEFFERSECSPTSS